MKLDANVKAIMLQFRTKNENLLPRSLPRLGMETEAEKAVRQSRSGGKQFIAPTKNVSLIEFIPELEAARYVLVGGSIKSRQNKVHGIYYYIRFVYVPYDNVSPEKRDEAGALRNNYFPALLKLCMDGWSLEAYNNPDVVDGSELCSARALSLNLTDRFPYYYGHDGDRIMVHKKVDGVKVGDPVPLGPDHQLKIVEEKIALVPAS